MKNLERILETWDTMFPDARCELNHSNPLELLIAVMLSAQTTDASVNRITPALFERYQTVEDYANADLKELEGYLHSIGLYRNKAKSVKNMAIALIEKYDGVVPQTMEELIELPGVGRKTANVVLADAFGVPGIAVDTHVTRIAKRLGFCYRNDDVLTIEKKLQRKIPKERWIKSHHQMIFFGRYFCKAQSPMCKECTLVDICREKNKKL